MGGVLKKKQEIRTPRPRKPQENKIIRYAFSVYFSLSAKFRWYIEPSSRRVFYRRAKERKKTDTRALFKRDAH